MLHLDETKIELAQARKGLSQKELIEKSGIAINTLQSIFSGKGCKPETVHKLAKALGVDPAELLKEK